MSRTIIGITSSREKTNSSSIQIGILETYLSAITNAGGIPLPIPLGIPNQLLDVLIQFIDGILFTGGGDIQPMLYKGKNHSSLSGIDSDRDRIELYLLKHAVKDNKPILGICRGIQLINVGMGGSLYEDILSQVPSALQHQTYPEHKPDFLAHEVKIETGTLLMEILGKNQIQVNSTHHQAIKTVGRDLNPIGYAPDGIIEAITIRNVKFGIGVQWHPERLQNFQPMRNLFQAFISAAKE